MDRAERRYRREKSIAKWIRLCFTFWRWPKDNGWYTEPGRLAKRNSVCSCVMCRASKWHETRDRHAVESDLEGYDHYVAKYNRINRRRVHPLLRRGGKSGTREGKKGLAVPKSLEELLNKLREESKHV